MPVAPLQRRDTIRQGQRDPLPLEIHLRSNSTWYTTPTRFCRFLLKCPRSPLPPCCPIQMIRLLQSHLCSEHRLNLPRNRNVRRTGRVGSPPFLSTPIITTAQIRPRHLPTLSAALVPPSTMLASTMPNPSRLQSPGSAPRKIPMVPEVGGELWDPLGSSPIGKIGTSTEERPRTSPRFHRTDDHVEAFVLVHTCTAVLLNCHCTSPEVRRGFQSFCFGLASDCT
jgi:hypothetical protein